MWAVVKYDRKKLILMQQEMRRRFGKNLLIYRPKLLIQKSKDKLHLSSSFDRNTPAASKIKNLGPTRALD